MKIKGKTPPPRKKLKLPEIISEDLTYICSLVGKK